MLERLDMELIYQVYIALIRSRHHFTGTIGSERGLGFLIFTLLRNIQCLLYSSILLSAFFDATGIFSIHNLIPH